MFLSHGVSSGTRVGLVSIKIDPSLMNILSRT